MIQEDKPSRQHEYLPKSVKNRHIDGYMLQMGTAANLPDGTTGVKVYFATDTGDLYIYNGSAWVSVTLS